MIQICQCHRDSQQLNLAKKIFLRKFIARPRKAGTSSVCLMFPWLATSPWCHKRHKYANGCYPDKTEIKGHPAVHSSVPSLSRQENSATILKQEQHDSTASSGRCMFRSEELASLQVKQKEPKPGVEAGHRPQANPDGFLLGLPWHFTPKQET